MFRLLLLVASASVIGILSFHFSSLDVLLLGHNFQGYFIFYSAIIPTLLLLLNSQLENSGLIINLVSIGASIGAGFTTSISLIIKLFSTNVKIVFPVFNEIIKNSLIDDYAWLLTNLTLTILITIAIFNSSSEKVFN